MLKTLIMQAPAKINLALWVKHKRPDGYHDLETLMQTLTLQDTLVLKQQRTPGITLHCDHPAVPTGPDNLVHKAARLAIERLSLDWGVEISIEKRIPVAAGLAGGSSDGAATLAGMVRMAERPLTVNELGEWALLLGSDVPFMLRGGLAQASGRGEQLVGYDSPRPAWHVVVAIPRGLQVSTKWAYENYTPGDDQRKGERFAGLLPAYRRRDLESLRRLAFNDLESVTLQRYPQVQQLKEAIAADGTGLVLMSGSGPSVFGLFLERAEAVRAASRLDPARYDVFLEKTGKAHA